MVKHVHPLELKKVLHIYLIQFRLKIHSFFDLKMKDTSNVKETCRQIKIHTHIIYRVLSISFIFNIFF